MCRYTGGLEGKIGKVPEIFKNLEKSDPDLYKKILDLDNLVWSDGALSRKEKKLIAIAIAAALRDKHALRSQTAGAKNLFVTEKEIEEALRVSFLLSGMPSYVLGKYELDRVYAENKK